MALICTLKALNRRADHTSWY